MRAWVIAINFWIVLTYLYVGVGIIAEAQPNKAYLKDGSIVIETPEGTKRLDYRSDNRYKKLHKWVVREEVNPVEEALKVFKKGEEKLYQKKVWIIDKQNGQKSILVEYASPSATGDIVFSPDEENIYYIGVDSSGTSYLYKMDLDNQQATSLIPASDLETFDCGSSDKKYLVVKEEGPSHSYVVYTFAGQQEDSLSGVVSWEDVKKYVCY